MQPEERLEMHDEMSQHSPKCTFAGISRNNFKAVAFHYIIMQYSMFLAALCTLCMPTSTCTVHTVV